MTSVPSPIFRALTDGECRALLERNHVGRLAFSFHDRVDIQPVHYVYDDGRLFGRTSEGSKLLTLKHNPWLAFEVDETRGIFDWESVVVHGRFNRLDSERSTPELAAADRALHRLRTLVPETFTAHDSTAFRTVLFQISMLDLSGRAAESK